MKNIKVKWLKFWYSEMIVKFSLENELPLFYELKLTDKFGERNYIHLGDNLFLPKKPKKERHIFFQITIL